ncbi:MAG: site-2 protease family protein [Clostridia bacterium]|nr:site-2 protease family protein [Clostridia bacterium]
MSVKCNPLVLIVIAVSFVFGLAELLLLTILSLSVHEFAHIYMAKQCGVSVSELELLPIGCVARMDTRKLTASKHERTIAMAGPLASALFALCVYGIAGVADICSEVLDELIALNLALCLFNLFPALPLDGGRVARSFLAERLGYVAATRACSIAGIALGFIAFGAGIALAVLDRCNAAPALIGFTILAASQRELKYATSDNLTAIASRTSRIFTGASYRTMVIAMHMDTSAGDAVKALSGKHYNVVNVVDSNMKRIGDLDEGALIEAIAKRGSTVSLGELCIDRPPVR